MKVNPSPERRHVFLRIATVPIDPGDLAGGRSAVTGRIACIGLLVDDGELVTEASLVHEDERVIVDSFWKIIEPNDVFVAFGLLDFDLPFIRQRSWLLGLCPTRRIDLSSRQTPDVFDLLQVWNSTSAPGPQPRLEAIGQALNCEGPYSKAPNLADWWAAGDIAPIQEYCRLKVRLCYRLYWRMMFRPLPERFLQAISLPPAPDETDGPPLTDKILRFPAPPDLCRRSS